MRTLACIFSMCIASSAWSSFKCLDDKGIAHFGDSPPAACANATTFEVSASGNVIRRIDAPAAAPDSGELAQKREMDRSSAEARRRDRALRDSFSSAREIEQARDRSLEMIKGRIESASLRMRQLEQREKDLSRAIASYGKGVSPAGLHADLESVRAEEASVAATHARYTREFEETGRKYEGDKARWIELRASR